VALVGLHTIYAQNIKYAKCKEYKDQNVAGEIILNDSLEKFKRI